MTAPLAHAECGVRGRAPEPGQASHAWALSGAIPTGVSIGSGATFARGKAPAPCKGKFPFRRNGITCSTILKMEFRCAILYVKMSGRRACDGSRSKVQQGSNGAYDVTL